MEGLQLLPENRQSQHDAGEGKSGPVSREQRPGCGRCRERSDIGMSAEQGRIRHIVEKLSPTLAHKQGVQIKDHGTECEHHSKGEHDVVANAPGHHQFLKINSNQMQSNQQPG